MKWDQIEHNWPQLSARVRRHWYRLTDDDVRHIGGKRESLVARVQERYGFTRIDAELEVDAWAGLLSVARAA